MRQAVDRATAVLSAAGIDSPRNDAELLAAHVAGTDRGRLALIDVPDGDFLVRYDEMISARAKRTPLQHITGTAAFGPLELRIGPGVFIPRPETEAMLEWVIRQELPDDPVIVDLCTGSGALAISLARRWPRARVVGIDDDARAVGYARKNAEIYNTAIDFMQDDVTDPALLSELSGAVDLVVANPPYIPAAAVLQPEAARHDPGHALFGGPDGMAVIEPIVALAARLCKPAGLFAVEHDETTSAATIDLISATRLFSTITARYDLTGRPRFATAVKIHRWEKS